MGDGEKGVVGRGGCTHSKDCRSNDEVWEIR